MAVSLDDGFAFQLRRLIVNSFFLQKLGQSESLLHQFVRRWRIWKYAVQFVAKHRAAARLECHYRRAGLDRLVKNFEYPHKIGFRLVKKSVVVERASAA